MDIKRPMFTCGEPAEWNSFAERNRLFLERYANLSSALDVAFTRTLNTTEPIEIFVFGYGRVCREDFLEVLLLAGNGFGVGALKLLRSLYEHAVTLSYLDKHNDELNLFYNWSYITEEKATNRLIEAFGEEFFESRNIDPAEIHRRYQNVKEQFMVTDCKKCKSRKLNHSWNKKSLVDMAKEAGRLKDLLIEAYYLPLTHTHSNPASMTTRLSLLESGNMIFTSGPQRDNSDVAVELAHRIILEVLQIQHNRFAIAELSDKLQICYSDFRDAWAHRKQEIRTQTS